ncbi:MAG: formylglycine-generating enzyme family protein [Proteobacteria bacterium]|nr:formylglycine-generating enzyme family protein [Pseudomonadota bacterium]
MSILLLIQSCSTQKLDWIRKNNAQVIYLIGPVYYTGDEGHYKLSLMLKKRIASLLSKYRETSFVLENREVYVNTIDWNLYDTQLEEVWLKLNAEIRMGVSPKMVEKVQAILNSFPPIAGKYLLFLKIKENRINQIEISGLRVVPGEKKGVSLGEFRVDSDQFDDSSSEEIEQILSSLREVVDDRKGPVAGTFNVTLNDVTTNQEKDIDRVLLKLILSKNYSSPGINSFGFEEIPEGCFMATETMPDGSNQEIEKCVSSFYLNQHPVTHLLWNQIMKGNSNRAVDQQNYPKVGISVDAIDLFLVKLSKSTGSKYRLPSEDEWEHACRLGKTGSSTLDHANLMGVNDYDRWEGLANVDASQADQMGLHNMVGNVWEWTESRFSIKRNGGLLSRIYERVNSPLRHTIKGGSFASSRAKSSCEMRKGLSPKTGNKDIGFRLVLDR